MSDIIADVQFYLNLKNEVENLKSKVKENAYSISYLHNQTSSLQSYVEDLRNKYENISSTLYSTVQEVAKLQSKFKDLNTYIDQVSADLSKLKSQFGNVTSSLTTAHTISVHKLIFQNGAFTDTYSKDSVNLIGAVDKFNVYLAQYFHNLPNALNAFRDYILQRIPNVKDNYQTFKVLRCSGGKYNLISKKMSVFDVLNGNTLQKYGVNADFANLINDALTTAISSFNNLHDLTSSMKSSLSNIHSKVNSIKTSFSSMQSNLNTIYNAVGYAKGYLQDIFQPFDSIFTKLTSQFSSLSSKIADVESGIKSLSNMTSNYTVSTKSNYYIEYYDPFPTPTVHRTYTSLYAFIKDFYTNALSHLNYGMNKLSSQQFTDAADDLNAGFRMIAFIPLFTASALKGYMDTREFPAFGYTRYATGKLRIAYHTGKHEYVEVRFKYGSSYVDKLYLSVPVLNRLEEMKDQIANIQATFSKAYTTLNNYTHPNAYNQYYDAVEGKYKFSKFGKLIEQLNTVQEYLNALKGNVPVQKIKELYDEIENMLNSIGDVKC